MPDSDRQSEDEKEVRELIRKLRSSQDNEGSTNEDEDNMSKEKVMQILVALEERERPTEFMGESAPERSKKEFFGEPERCS